MANNFDLQEQEQLEELKHFWNKWGTPITWALVVIMGSFAAWNGYRLWQGRQAQQATALVEAVELAAQTGDMARVEQAFGDLQSGYGGTTQAGQAGLLAAKALADAGKWDAAKGVLTWVAEKSSDEGYVALARLRLAGVQHIPAIAPLPGLQTAFLAGNPRCGQNGIFGLVRLEVEIPAKHGMACMRLGLIGRAIAGRLRRGIGQRTGLHLQGTQCPRLVGA